VEARVAQAPPHAPPLVVAVDMGYGHLRPAHALAAALGTEVSEADRPPLAADDERKVWKRVRGVYEATTRWSQIPLVGAPLRSLVARYTYISHLHPYRDQSKPNMAVRFLERSIRKGLGHHMIETLQRTGRPLLTTFFVPALAADAAGYPHIYCVVTDSDINRSWASPEPAKTNIRYLVPSMRALRRLRSYGVPQERILVTGYPLPGELLGDEDLGVLKRNLAARLVRLDPRRSFLGSYPDELRHFLGDLPDSERGRPPLLTFAVGGAGAQTEVADRFLPGLRPDLEEGRMHLALVAGIRPHVRERFEASLERAGCAHLVGQGIEILFESDIRAYFRSFNELLARSDVLWTKPSELTFFGALGIPLVLSAPVGVHEWYNRRWARENGSGLKQRDERYAHQWLREWLEDGLLAAAAWSGFMRLPKFGLHRIRKLFAAERTEHAV